MPNEKTSRSYKADVRCSVPLFFMIAAVLSCVNLMLHAQQRNWWGKTEYEGRAWVTNVSRPYSVTRGLEGRHISLWASHGRYYSHDRNTWKWQRVNLFCTNEDVFTQTFVVPYLIPMLERAGANVFMPRERDWQQHETVIDNDGAQMAVDGNIVTGAVTNYVEDGKWRSFPNAGFRMPYHYRLVDGDMPFAAGTARQVKTRKRKASAFVIYSPKLEEAGSYAVYVSYQTVRNSVDDAHYIVVHKGVETHFTVNQRMGGGTWVYLGTFDFGAGESMDNCVIVDNVSSCGGTVTTDAVRFGGGMGNIVRGGTTSGLARCMEGARYYAQWAGAPYTVYSQRKGTDDYADDINARSLMTNWLAGGSPYVPDRDGQNVPVELSLALHSDAGYDNDMKSVYGSLGICTTDFNDGRLAAGHSRLNSKDLASVMLSQIDKDMKAIYRKWNVRGLLDKNYSETRLPGMPSAIIEMLSHQSFPDMALAHDPNFKFNLARAMYKGIARYITQSHGEKCVIAPLAPHAMSVTMDHKGKAKVMWKATSDPIESDADPTSYVLYIAVGDGGYDNGQVVKSTAATLSLLPDVLYRFRVTATNKGGESLPSEEMCAYYHPDSDCQVMIVNGFHRLASPQVKKIPAESMAAGGTRTYSRLGFDIDEDPGVSYGRTPAFVGRQQTFSVSAKGDGGPGSFGSSGNEMMGSFMAGNDFNYAAVHAEAIATAGRYSVVSCSSECIGGKRGIDLSDYELVDLILGNERDDGYSLKQYRTFPVTLRNALNSYKGGLMVSGSYIGSDNTSPADSAFIAEVLHSDYVCQYRDSSSLVSGLGTQVDYWHSINGEHYASTSSDVLAPSEGAFTALAYADGSPAATAYNVAPRRTFTIGFPFECIREKSRRAYIMRGIMAFLKP